MTVRPSSKTDTHLLTVAIVKENRSKGCRADLVERGHQTIHTDEYVVVRLKCEHEVDVLHGPAVEGRRLLTQRVVALFDGQVLPRVNGWLEN